MVVCGPIRRVDEQAAAPWGLVRACTESIFFTATRSALRAKNREWVPEPAGLRVHDGSQVDCRLLPRLARRRGGAGRNGISRR